MDDWFALLRRYETNPRPRGKLLKGYGQMACRAFIEDRFGATGKETRILEMGHGFAPDVMVAFQDKHDVWGVDDDQGKKYFNHIDWSARYQTHIVSQCPSVTLRRGLVGSAERVADLPEGYFDLIFSISIVEEVPEPVLAAIVAHAARLLKPGGWLIGTHDTRQDMIPERIEKYLRYHRDNGLCIDGAPCADDIFVDWRYAVVEHPDVVMLAYMHNQPFETRKYRGHFTTLFTAAQKRES